MKCEGQKPFKVKKSDKLILIIDSNPSHKCSHEMIRVDYKEQLRYFSKFLSNFLSDKLKIRLIILDFRRDLAFGKKGDFFSSFRIEDKLSNIDFFEDMQKGTLFVFMVINHKRKPKYWSAQDYFRY